MNNTKFSILKFVFYFYILYFLFTLAGSNIIDYNDISFKVILIYSTYVFFLLLGISIGLKTPRLILKQKIIINNIELLSFLLVLFSFSLTIYKLSTVVEYAGSIKKVIETADDIRWKFIKREINLYPLLAGYLTGIQHFSFALMLVLYISRKRKIYMFLAVFSFITAILDSFIMFGRVSILFNIFLLTAILLINNVKIINIRNVFIILILIYLLNLPRLIRGSFDNFSATLNKIPIKFHIPNIFNIFLVVFVYYFSSLYALDAYLKEDHQLTFGKQLFLPIYNILGRIFGFQTASLYEVPVYIPFKYNVYTIIKYLIEDFSYLGLVFIPIFYGIVIGNVFKYKTLEFIVLQMFFITWIFFTPIYNIFSFGSYFVALLFSFFFAVFFRIK
ncbi:MAG: O-antigen polymerase [Tenuifilum sp.]|uniref:O-antigen polymerase n=1 Tax=Tenuifilum sp. TaxID=2760880 RepID=UPI0030B43D5B